MGLFRRRHDGDDEALPGNDEPDNVFPFLTVGQAARLRALTRQTFAEHGVESEIRPGQLVAGDGWRFDLHQLFAVCHRAAGGERAWRDIVRAHVARVVRLDSEPASADLSAEQLLHRSFVRVCSERALQSLDAFGYRRRLGGDLVELIARDTVDGVTYLTDDDVQRVGADALRAAGVENLLAEPFGEVQWVDAPRRTRFAVLVGESIHTASRLLTLEDVLRRSQGSAGTPNGVIVSVPNRHLLAFHRPEDASLVRVIEGLTRFTIENFAEGSGGISPHVYWRPPGGGRLQQLTEINAPDHIGVRIDGHFAEVVQRLLGLPRDDQ